MDILPGKIDEAHETAIAGLGDKFIVNPQTGCAVRFYQYDPAETTLTLAVGDPVGLKAASETVITADISAAVAGGGLAVGVLLAAPTASARYVFVLVSGSITDDALPTITLTTDGNVAAGDLLIWGANQVIDPVVDLNGGGGAVNVQAHMGVALAADSSTTLSAARIHTAFA